MMITLLGPSSRKNSKSRGILILANGERDRMRARYLLESLSNIGSREPVAVLADDECTGFNSRFYKTQLLSLSPFEFTLFLDSDIIALKAFGNIWDRLEHDDLWMCLDRYPTVGIALSRGAKYVKQEEVRETRAAVILDAPYFNTGAILFRRSPRAVQFFDTWHDQWARYSTFDQFAAARACAILGSVPSQLPQRYNYPIEFYRQSRQKAVVFVHCWGVPLRQYSHTLHSIGVSSAPREPKTFDFLD